MTYSRIRRKSDGRWLGLNMGIQEKWLKSKSGAHAFSDTCMNFEYWKDKLRGENPKETYEIKESET